MNPKSALKCPKSEQLNCHLLSQASVLLIYLAVPALVSAGPQPTEMPSAGIPLSDTGARATADYHGDALGITATADGARLRCGFQKLEGHATAEGLWLESTAPGAEGKFRLVATAVGRTDGVGSSRSDDRTVQHVVPTTILARTGTVSVDDKLVRFTRPGLTEEYSVSVDGVRQDFVVMEKPAGQPLTPSLLYLNFPLLLLVSKGLRRWDCPAACRRQDSGADVFVTLWHRVLPECVGSLNRSCQCPKLEPLMERPCKACSYLQE